LPNFALKESMTNSNDHHNINPCLDGTCFVCPHCYAYLNVGNQLIFKVITKENVQGLVILTTKPGDFNSVASKGIKKVKGDLYNFHCPICHASLHDKKMNENLVKILLIDNDNTKNEIYFSGIFGEKCSFMIRKGQVRFFGKHYQEYLNQIEKYKNYYDSKL
jgi:hypothetical protein